MGPDKPRRPRKNRKLGRGLSEVSHIFLSGAEKPPPQASDQLEKPLPESDDSLWMPEASLISVTSGERVRGKTFLTANLAFGLKEKGRTVAIVDADRDKPDIMDITAAAPAQGRDGLAEAWSEFGSIPVVDLLGKLVGSLPDGDSTGGLVEPLQAVEVVARSARSVVIDTAPRADRSTAIWKISGLTVVIAAPSAEAMRSSYATIKRVRSASPHGRIGLVVNMASGRAEAGKCFRKISGVCRQFLKTNIRNYGYIVLSDVVAEACDKAIPLTRIDPGSDITRCIGSILRLITMDESAIARRRREVTVKTCALRKGR